MYGREELLKAHDKAAEERARKAGEARDKTVENRKTLLGRSVLAYSIDHIDSMKNGVTFMPNKKGFAEFRRALVLPDDFDFDALDLAAQGDTTSGFLHYDLRYHQGDDGVDQMFHFSAHQRGQMAGTTSETWLFEGTEPIEFETPAYRYVRDITGLFLPSVVQTLNAEGL
jgi:hypothetical protein